MNPNLMTTVDASALSKPIRVGLLLGDDLSRLRVPALKFLLLNLNHIQTTFEYQFLPQPANNRFLKYLSGTSPKDRSLVQREAPKFLNEYKAFLGEIQKQFSYLQEPLPEYYVLITLARFSDNFYLTESGRLGIIALGNWKRVMAPPSLIEFALNLVVVETVYLLGMSVGNLSHLGTKGCAFDFNLELENVRFGILQGFICSHCSKELEKSNYPELLNNLSAIFNKKWLGEPTDHASPAGIVSNLGYDLFFAKGIKPTLWETLVAGVKEEGVKELLKLLTAIILAILLFYFGLKSS